MENWLMDDDELRNVGEPGVELICSECGSANPPDCIFCLNCGAMLPAVETRPPAMPAPQARAKKRRWGCLAAGAAGFVLLGLLLLLFVVPPSSGGMLRLEYALGRRHFRGADLSGAKLYGGADLSEADLSGASLSQAKLYGASLPGANLREADLTEASVADVQLAKAVSLKGATMPDGSVHE
jgi:hypothetical protein